MTDYKALCAELVEQLNQVSAHIEATTPFETVLSGLRAYNRARNALAQPEPEGPSDEELLAVAAGAINPYETCGIAIGEYEAETECAIEVYGSELIAFARAVLARWGTPNSEEVRRSLGGAPQSIPVLTEGTQVIEPTERTLLVPVAQPIPVRERLPGPEGPSEEELDLVVIAIQALIPPQPDATTHHLSAVDRGREILRQRLARWVHPQGT
jgi:hypothetical protein